MFSIIKIILFSEHKLHSATLLQFDSTDTKIFQAVALILVSVCPTWTMGQLIGDIDKDALKALVEEQTAEQEEKDSGH